MKNKAKLRKTMILIIVIILPLLAAFLIGQYGYNRYQGEYTYQYMNAIEENTESKINGYLKLYTNYYDSDPIYKSDVAHEEGTALRLEIYRGTVTQLDPNSEEEFQQLQYYIAVYNIDYEKLVDIEDPTGEKKLLYNNIPSIYFRIKDKNNSENVYTQGLQTTAAEALVEDYNATPKKDYRGNEINGQFLRWFVYTPDNKFSNEVSFELFMTDTMNEENATYHSTITLFDLANFATDAEAANYEEFAEGYEGSIFEAGYLAFIFKTKLWWQALIAFVLVGVITFSFYAVWTFEDKQSYQANRKK
jgi:hypothetical protein